MSHAIGHEQADTWLTNRLWDRVKTVENGHSALIFTGFAADQGEN
jgi:hypothetical protein